MRTIIWGKTFARAYKRKIKRYSSLSKDIEGTLRLLAKEPFAPQLETHKLKGELSGSWTCSAGYDLSETQHFVNATNGCRWVSFLNLTLKEIFR